MTSSFKDAPASPESRLLGLMQLIKQTIKPFLLYEFCVFLLQRPFGDAAPGLGSTLTQESLDLRLGLCPSSPLSGTQVRTKETSLSSLVHQISDGSQEPVLIHLSD